MATQRPLELILARNLLSSISTPAFLIGQDGVLLFFNEAAGVLVGRRFEETGAMEAREWVGAFGPFGPDEKPMDYEQIPAVLAVRGGRPFHGKFRICGADGHQDIEASAIPIVGPEGSSGGIVVFWPVDEDE